MERSVPICIFIYLLFNRNGLMHNKRVAKVSRSLTSVPTIEAKEKPPSRINSRWGLFTMLLVGLRATFDAFLGESFDNIADLKCCEVFEHETTLVASLDLANIIFATTNRGKLAFKDLFGAALDAYLRGAGDFAVYDTAASNNGGLAS